MQSVRGEPVEPRTHAAALRVVARGGPEDVSLRELARQVGVSPRAPYRHFASKEALLAAVAAEAFRRYEAHLEAALAEAGPDPWSGSTPAAGPT